VENHKKTMWKTAEIACGKPHKTDVVNHKKVLYFPHCFIEKAPLTLSKNSNKLHGTIFKR
jgi:hypothetical protein